MTTMSDREHRIRFEAGLMRLYGGDWHRRDDSGLTMFEGWTAPSGCFTRYRARLVLPPGFPCQQPDLYVIEPCPLRSRVSGKFLYEFGTSHAFHIYKHEPQVKICYTQFWDASTACVKVLVKLVLWLLAYEQYLNSGRTIADLLSEENGRLADLSWLQRRQRVVGRSKILGRETHGRH